MADIDELEAMKQMGALMEQLDEAAQGRSLDWLNSKFGKSLRHSSAPLPPLGSATVSQAIPAGEYASFAELHDAAQPPGDREKALVAAYWAQVCQGSESFASQTLNDLLKDLGHGVSNITEALTRAKAERPALILQLKKSGTSRQARKTYKLTQEGIRRVAALIAANSAAARD